MIEVSGELFFFQNFIMNFIILHLTGYFFKKEESMIRLFIGASIGAIYSFIFFVPSLHYLLGISFKFIVSIVMVVVAFLPYRFKDFFKQLFVFYLISFVFGGATFALFYFTDFRSILSNGIFYLESFSVQMVYYAVAVAYLLIVVTMHLIKSNVNKANLFKDIIIKTDGMTTTVRGMIDTGNSLTEPLTNTPVIVVEIDSLMAVLPNRLAMTIKNEETIDLSILVDDTISSYWASRLKIIPFSSLGQKNGMLVGFRPDSVLMENEDDPYEFKKVIIGITSTKLSQSGDYSALLNPNLLI